jgi:hypothetical protein
MQQRRVWWHFALVMAILTVYSLFMRLASYRQLRLPPVMDWGGVGYALLLDLPGIVIGTIPLAVGVGLAVIELRRGALRTAGALLLLALVTMVVYDVWGQPRMRAVERHAERSRPRWPLLADSSPPRLRDTTGTLQRALAFAAGRVRVQDLQPWPPPPEDKFPGFSRVRDARIILRIESTRTATQLIQFVLPALLAGLVLGMGSWLTTRVTFRSPRDGRILRVVSAWIVVMATSGVIYAWANDMNFGVEARHLSFAWLFVPIVPAALLSALGWRSASRTSRAMPG